MEGTARPPCLFIFVLAPWRFVITDTRQTKKEPLICNVKCQKCVFHHPTDLSKLVPALLPHIKPFLFIEASVFSHVLCSWEENEFNFKQKPWGYGALRKRQRKECKTPPMLWFITFRHVRHMNVMRTCTFSLFYVCFPFLLHIYLPDILQSPLSHRLFSLNAPPCSLAFCLLIRLSFCLGRVWPCPSLPLQEVVSRLIENRLRSLELNTCS